MRRNRRILGISVSYHGVFLSSVAFSRYNCIWTSPRIRHTVRNTSKTWRSLRLALSPVTLDTPSPSHWSQSRTLFDYSRYLLFIGNEVQLIEFGRAQKSARFDLFAPSSAHNRNWTIFVYLYDLHSAAYFIFYCLHSERL